MKSILSRGLLTLVVVVALSALTPSAVKAETELGDFCWLLPPFIDTLRLTAVQADFAVDNFLAMHGRLKAGTPTLYQIEMAGHMSDNALSPGNLALAVIGAHGTTFFGNDRNCSIFANLNGVTFTGPFTIECSPGPGAASFGPVTGTLTSTACTPAFGSESATGPAAGE